MVMVDGIPTFIAMAIAMKALIAETIVAKEAKENAESVVENT